MKKTDKYKEEIAEKENKEKKKPNTINVRVDYETKDIIADIAAEFGCSKSFVVRFIIDGRIERLVSRIQFMDAKQGREIKDAILMLANHMSIYKNELDQIERQLRRIGVNYNQAIKKNDVAILPQNEIENMLEKTKRISDSCEEVFAKYGEVLFACIPT